MSTDDKLVNKSEQSTATDEFSESPGTILRKAREAAHRSLREVADDLHLVSSQVKALEEDRYDYFHGDIFCRGYLRSYGKLMELDTEPLIDGYLQLCPEEPPGTIKTSNAKIQHVQIPGKGRTIQYWCIAVVLVVATLLWALSGGSNEALSPSLLDNENLLAVDESDRSLLKSLEKQIKEMPIASVQAGEADTTAMIIQELDGSEVNDVNGSSSIPTVVENSTNAQLENVQLDSQAQLGLNQPDAMTGKDVLNFSFSDDCWIEVFDADGNLLLADLKRANDVLKLNGQAPFEIVLGYTPAVNLKFNGEPVTISSTRTSNTAKITVGQP